MDKDNEDNSSSQSHKTDSDDSNLSNVSSVYSDDDPLDMLEHESYKSYSDNSMSEYENSDDSMLEENNNDPNNNMSDENLEGRDPSSPQPGCSRHFDSIENGHANSLASKLTSEQISGIAENILQAITKLLGSVTHESIVEAIQKNITTGNNKLSLQDLLPSEFNLEVTRKRRNSQDVSGVDMKKSRGNSTTPGSPVLAGFLAGNPINIDNLQEMPKYHPVETLTNNNNPNPVANVDKTNYSLPAVNILPSTPLNNPVNLPLQRPAPINNGIIIPVRKNIVAQATTKFTVSDSGERILNRVPDSKPSTVTSKAQVHMLKQQFLQHQLQQQKFQQQLHQPQLQHQNLQHRVYFNDIINSKSATVGSNANANANDRQKNVDDYFAELRRTKLKLTMEKAKLQQHSHTVKNNHVVINQPVLVPPKKNDAQEAAGSAMVSSKYDQVQSNPSTSNAGSSKVCEEIYQKLRAMFPDIDREYIKTFCPADWAPGTSHDVQFGSIVERILQNEASWVINVHPTNFMIQEAAENDRLTPNVDDTYEYLTGIFPNADPHFLRSAAEEFKNENDVKTFVDEKLKSHDYPTREQYLAKIKVTEEQQRYTKNFNVEQFLRLIPDPFKHFEDNKRKCEYSLIVLEFLKNVFSRVRVNTISRIYRRHSHILSLAAKELRNSSDFIVTPRRANEIPTEDISLLQEMAFVRHYQEIHDHMEMTKKREEEEFNSLKAAGSLWTCQCCFDDECMPSQCSTCENTHVFCNSCVIKGTDTRLGDGETRVPCFLNCGSEFSISTLQHVLPPTKFSILLKKRQAAEVMAAGLEGLVSCPFCHFASIPAEGDKVFKCLNPECMKESCIQCKEPNHVPYKCGELDKKDKARKYIEEKMTQALTRTCYQCKRAFFKEEGCNKMLCPCGAMMCYICNQPVKGYDHFRGQGSTEMNKCPLWSDNIRLNAETVRKVEETARAEVLRQDPTLDIGTTELAPALPPPTAGPHRDIPETQNLANVLAARVLNNDRLNLEDLNRNRNRN